MIQGTGDREDEVTNMGRPADIQFTEIKKKYGRFFKLRNMTLMTKMEGTRDLAGKNACKPFKTIIRNTFQLYCFVVSYVGANLAVNAHCTAE